MTQTIQEVMREEIERGMIFHGDASIVKLVVDTRTIVNELETTSRRVEQLEATTMADHSRAYDIEVNVE